jgi:hypothetical protein
MKRRTAAILESAEAAVTHSERRNFRLYHALRVPGSVKMKWLLGKR